MITKLALLPRILPGLFRRLPAATSVGYLMPHTRYVFAGISGSVALHAAVLFAFGPPPPPPPVGVEDVVLGGDWTEPILLPPEPPPPPDPALEVKATDETKPSEVGEDYPRLPDPIPKPGIDAFIVNRDTLDLGHKPDLKNARWDPPAAPPGPGTATKTITYNPKDLDKVPVATNRAAPRYPFEMKRTGLSGMVVLRFVVDSRGDVSDVEVVSATTDEFGTAATEAMLKWKFRAGMKNGRRVNTRMEMPMNFSLDRS